MQLLTGARLCATLHLAINAGAVSHINTHDQALSVSCCILQCLQFQKNSACSLSIPVIAGIQRQAGTGWLQLALVVARTLSPGHAAAVEQVKTWGTVAAVVAVGGALHLGGGHVQTDAWTGATLCLTLCHRHVHHALWTHTWRSRDWI